MSAVNVLMKPSSSMCNMVCDYCFYCDETKKRAHASYGFMSEQTLKNIIRRTMLPAEGMINYAFQGGEPTLCGIDFFKKAVAYQQHYNKNHIQVRNAFQTNGYLIDDEWCRFFKENQFLIGLSIDGTEEIHDSMRHSKSGCNTFSRVIRSAELMDKFQVDYNILTVVTPAIADNIHQIYQSYKRRGWHFQQYIACLEPLDEVHGIMPYALSPEKYGQFLIDLFHLWYQDLQDGTAPYIRQFDNFAALSEGYISEACDQRGTCSIQYVTEADGSVYPCDFYMLDEYCLGNFNLNRLIDIDKRREEIGFIDRSLQLSTKCHECNYYRLCRGGCQRNRDFDSSTGRYINYFCISYQMFFDSCYDKIVASGAKLFGK